MDLDVEVVELHEGELLAALGGGQEVDVLLPELAQLVPLGGGQQVARPLAYSGQYRVHLLLTHLVTLHVLSESVQVPLRPEFVPALFHLAHSLLHPSPLLEFPDLEFQLFQGAGLALVLLGVLHVLLLEPECVYQVLL